MTGFDFRGLFVCDLANNHQGSVAHALKIIEEVGRVAAANHARTAFKFQFRELDTFVHPRHRQGSDNKHIPRFLGTRLTTGDFEKLTQAVRAAGMITMATPFDEASVELFDQLDINVVKVASCSATDWPLLEKIASFNRPVVVSTGGLTLDQVDDLVSYFEHRRVDFALMHCVSIYPTPLAQLELNQIDLLRRRHPGRVVGFSTHEDPDELTPVAAAVAKGAQILERHVGLPTAETKLNGYSSTPAQIDRWMKEAARAWLACGSMTRRPASEVELGSLRSLQRGAFASRDVKKGETLVREDVYFAMPCDSGQLTSGCWRAGIIAAADMAKDAPLALTAIELPQVSEKAVMFHAIHAIKSMLNEAQVKLPTDFQLEFSHHYGIPRFREIGATIIDCINRAYCKKIIVQLPGQFHPNHYHKSKEEAFQVLSGVLQVRIDDRERTLLAGDILVVPQGVWHEFWTEGGVIFEEISTTHFNNDSFYEDKQINQIPRSRRKTVVSHWGRYQI